MKDLSLRNVSFSYPGGFLAVDDVSIDIKGGENVAIVGQNGAGKTTTVKMINGLLRPTKGDVLVGDMNTKDYTTAQVSRIVGYVFQNPDDQIFHATVEEEVRFGPKNMKLSMEEEDSRVEDALKITGMDIYRSENPMNLPLSVRKFVTIAAVISMGTEILIFDEPTAGQDIDGNRRLSQILKTMQARGKTIITISHDMEFVAENFDRVIIMAKKKVVKEGTPEEIFLNYVLFHRVNEEEIAQCRTYFRAEIGSRIQGMNFREAALEVNYWCAEEATYHCTDDRTLSAISVYRRGNGRCGEESVFTVNALRSVGVPARQVYAPKWSHCDDNHAWVEIWCDGKWYFLGACEPEEILNKGWFTNASSRAMMIHSRVFDTKIPEGEVIGTDGMVTMLNELKRYAVTKEITVTVKDAQGLPSEGAEVSFEVLNYSEYAPIAEKKTDSKGTARLTTGLGICIFPQECVLTASGSMRKQL